ncbi:MAG TPA: OmpH family outer membrane protein [Gemmatimonadaceae bacterium]
MRSYVRAALSALAISTLMAGTVLAQGGVVPPTTSSPSSSATPKIAYVNSQKILAEVPGRSDAEAQMQKEMEGYRAEVQKMSDSLNALVSAYNKAEPTLSATAKATRQKDIQTKESAYQQRVQQLEQQAQQRQAELMRPIMQNINKVIEQIRSEDGYAMVFDAGNQSGVVVAADSSLDITAKVIQRLKAAGPISTTPQKPPTGPASKPLGAARPDSSHP